MANLLTPDEYMELLVSRQEAWVAAHPPHPDHPDFRQFPPLYHWFIQDGDEDIVDEALLAEALKAHEPAQKPKQARAAQPRQRRSADDIRAEIERIETRMAGLGQPLSDDPAAVRLSNARTLRRHHARMDRELEEYTRLTERLKRLRFQLADAESRETKGPAS